MTQAQTQAEALRLADWCDENSAGAYRPSAEAAAELRRLHADNEKLRGSLEAQRLITDRAIAIAKQLEARAQPAREPLDPMHPPGLTSANAILSFNHGWRACQLAHGITGGSDGIEPG